MDQGYIDALKREREHYVRTGNKDRAAAVDAELKRAGAAATSTPPAVEVAAVEAPETTSRPRATRKAAQ